MTAAQTFIVRPEGDPSRATVLANVLGFVPKLPGNCAWEIQIRKRIENRSQKANSYMWAALYAPMVAVVGHTPADWHEYMCGSYFGWKRITKPGGRTEEVPKRTTTTNELGQRDVLKGPEFALFLEFVASQAAQHGVFIEVDH